MTIETIGMIICYGLLILLAFDLRWHTSGQATISSTVRAWLNEDGPLPVMGSVKLGAVCFIGGFLLNHFLFKH